MTAALLQIENLSVRYGAVRALQGVNLTVHEGEFVLVLGPNGAGKTTTLRTVSGLHRAAEGRIRFAGKDIGRVAGAARPRLGIGHVPEGRRIFPDHTVLENLQLGAFVRRRARPAFDDVFDLFPVLGERRGQLAGTLSGGEAQMLAVARALVSKPRLLMLDEPSLGLAPLKVAEMFRYLSDLHRSRGIAVLLVEQQARVALRLADRAYVYDRGRVVLDGPAARLRDDERIRHAYLGAPLNPQAG